LSVLKNHKLKTTKIKRTRIDKKLVQKDMLKNMLKETIMVSKIQKFKRTLRKANIIEVNNKNNHHMFKMVLNIIIAIAIIKTIRINSKE